MSKPTRLNVLFMASEADPLIKVGGLGDVAGSLPRALRALRQSPEYPWLNLDVRLVIPFHPFIKTDTYSPQLKAEFPLKTADGEISARAYSLNVDGLPIYLIGGSPIDQETGVYSLDLEADGYKYVFFSMAALELPRIINWKPDIYHANDWHTAAAVYSLALRRPTQQFYRFATSMLTIHNLPYLGSMTSPALAAFGLHSAVESDLPPWAQHMALPLGIMAADEIVAVSPGYSKEILTEEFGSGLAEYMQSNRHKIFGILNGLDTRRWDPGQDGALFQNYSLTELDKRSANKSFLQQELELEVNSNIPLLAMVTRMDPQKGVDLAVAAIHHLLSTDIPASIQAVFLGTGDPNLEDSVRQLEHDFPDQVRGRILYDEHLSRHIYAGADALLMPSRYEPCGLSQMIAMRYGSVPIARSTGGLSDTIHDIDNSADPTGLLFGKPTVDELVKAIKRAMQVYIEYPDTWRHILVHAMNQDFSWDRSAREYLARYRILSGC